MTATQLSGAPPPASASEFPRELRAQQWMNLIPDDQWSVYRDAIAIARGTGRPFMLGGGFALAAYTGRWRNTKDIDFYILPEDRETLARAFAEGGFSDYYDQVPYDRGWIRRGFRDGAIVDLIWSMANRRAETAQSWIDHARLIDVRGEHLRLIAPEELLWCKLYVLQRDHSDWPDLLNLLHAAGRDLDWDRILNHLGEDAPLLRALLGIFGWLCPETADGFPAELKRHLQLVPEESISREAEDRRIRLLDTRKWFAGRLPVDEVLEI